MITRYTKIKLNLFLQVLGKKEGLHLLNSLIIFLKGGDEISVDFSSVDKFKVIGDYSDDIHGKNSLLTALHLFRSYFNISSKFSIVLKKNLPVASGIGGGSIDATTLLLMLAKLCDIKQNIDPVTLLKLGYDAPVCYGAKNAICTGFGNELKELQIDFNGLHFLLVTPNVHISTRKIFAMSHDNWSLNKDIIKCPTPVCSTPVCPTPVCPTLVWPTKMSNTQLLTLLQHCHNDLLEACVKLCPTVDMIIKYLITAKGCEFSSLSGSGATCFGIFKNKEDLQLAKSKLPFKDCFVYTITPC